MSKRVSEHKCLRNSVKGKLITSCCIDKILDFFNQGFDGQTSFFQLFFMGMQILPEVRAVCEALGELQRQEPHGGILD